MSDLSWLNPTPHAIAVYASRPLSPVATQHSLPSGRYPLLGPDLHRLDRTSLRLAHSLDHLVGAQKHYCWDREAECIGGLEVQDELELGGGFNGRHCGICTQQNLSGHDTLLSDYPQPIRSICHQSAVPRKLGERRDGRQPVFERKVCQQFRGTSSDRRRQHHHGPRTFLDNGLERRLELAGLPHL